MANYTANYPALPNLASGADDHPAAAIIAGTPLNDNDTDAAKRQTKHRELLGEANQATAAEIHAARNRALGIAMENASGNAAIPAWTIIITNQLNAMQKQFNIMQNQFNTMQNTTQNQFNTIQNQLNTIQNQLDNMQVRQGNLNTDCPNHMIQPLRNPAGVVPPNFPATRAALDGLDGVSLTNILNFYGEPVPHQVEDRRISLKRFLGVPL